MKTFLLSAQNQSVSSEITREALTKLAVLYQSFFNRNWGPFLESPGKLTGSVSYFEIKFSRKVCCVLTSNEAHFVSLANNFTIPFSKLLKIPSLMETKQLNGPGNYRELRETGPGPYCLPVFYSTNL